MSEGNREESAHFSCPEINCDLFPRVDLLEESVGERKKKGGGSEMKEGGSEVHAPLPNGRKRRGKRKWILLGGLVGNSVISYAGPAINTVRHTA